MYVYVHCDEINDLLSLLVLTCQKIVVIIKKCKKVTTAELTTSGHDLLKT